MEDFWILKSEDMWRFDYMIPDWILQLDPILEDITFWGMTDWNEPCGVAVTTIENGIPTMIYLYIDPDYRRSGKAERLIREIMYQSYKRGSDCIRVKYIPDKYPQIVNLLRLFPGEKEEEFVGTASGTIEEFLGLKYLQGNTGSVKALSQCTQASLRSLYKKIVEQGEDLIELPPKKGEYVEECSAIIMENGVPAGLLLVKKEGEEIKVPYMINLSSDIAAPIEMIRFALKKGGEMFPLQTRCSFVIINEILFQLLGKIGVKTQKREVLSISLEQYKIYERNANVTVGLAMDLEQMRG